jgi:hypothetical protein
MKDGNLVVLSVAEEREKGSKPTPYDVGYRAYFNRGHESKEVTEFPKEYTPEQRQEFATGWFDAREAEASFVREEEPEGIFMILEKMTREYYDNRFQDPTYGDTFQSVEAAEEYADSQGFVNVLIVKVVKIT